MTKDTAAIDFDSHIVSLFDKTEVSKDKKSAAPSKRNARTRRSKMSMIVVGVICAAGLGWYFLPRGAERTPDVSVIGWVQNATSAMFQSGAQPELSTTDIVQVAIADGSAAPLAPPSTVPVLPVAQSIVFSGYVVARNPVGASLQTEGIVTDVLVDVGTHVVADQVLARLDPASVDLAVASAELDLQAAQSRVTAADFILRQADVAVDRAVTLQSRQAVSDVAVADAVFSREAAQLALDRAQIEASQYEIALSRQLALRVNHTITSPIAGIISESNLNVGAWHRPGAYAVCGSICSAFVIVDPQNLQVEGEITESRLRNINIGDLVSFHSIADPTAEATGRVERISPSVSREKATLKVIISFDAGASASFTPNVAVKISTTPNNVSNHEGIAHE